MPVFNNYNNININNKPYNSNCCNTNLNIPFVKEPNVDYDANGNVIGYFWHYGDAIDFNIHLTGTVQVPVNSIIYYYYGECPSENTAGEIGNKAYNVVDLKSWTCTAIVEDEPIKYCWTLDDEFLDTEVGLKVYMTAEQYLSDKYIRVTIYTDRHVEYQTIKLEGHADISLHIGPSGDITYPRGVYYMDVVVCDEANDRYETVINNVMLTVK